MFLDESLNFIYYIKEKMFKAIKGIGIIKKLCKTLPGHALIAIYITYLFTLIIIILFMTNQSLNQKIERIQYNATLPLQVPLKEHHSKLYNELGFESLKFRR